MLRTIPGGGAALYGDVSTRAPSRRYPGGRPGPWGLPAPQAVACAEERQVKQRDNGNSKNDLFTDLSGQRVWPT